MRTHIRDGEFVWEPLTCFVITTAAAIIGSAIIGGVAAAAGAKAQTKAADKAATVQQQAQTSADAQYQQTREDFAPWRAAGTDALGKLTQFGAEPGAFAEYVKSDPGYQFGMDEGTRAVTSNAASRGLLNSGATLKALTRFGQDYASTKAGDVWNRYSGIADMGRGATGATAGYGAQNSALGVNSAADVGNAYMAAGAARASGYGGVAQSANMGIQNYMLADWMKKSGGYGGPNSYAPYAGHGYVGGF